jgi:PKD repeat protein
MLKSHFPTYTKTEIENLILDNADNIDAVNPSYVGLLGAGRINAWNCLQHAPAAPFTASPRVGTAPLTVNFDDQNATAIDRYWSFGDGQNSADEDPVHTYTEPGLYDVSLEVTDPNGTTEKTKKYFIFASAYTVYGDPETTVPVSATHDSFPVPIYMKNTVPLTGFMLSFDWITETGTADLQFKAVSVEGTRAADFDTVIVRAVAPTTGKVAIEFKAIDLDNTVNDELPPGDGVVANLWFSSSGSGTLVLDTINLVGYQFGVSSRYVGYTPGFELIHIKTGFRGDANDDGDINAGDPVFLINYVFKGGPAPSTTYNGDANADGAVNVADAVYLINYIFKSGPPPPP